jgi:hypothetical protein
MSDAFRPDSLQPALRKVEDELAKHLDEACEATHGDVSHGSVDELLRLEEELLAAARAADEAVRLRRRLGERGAAQEPTNRAPAMPLEDAIGRVREFRDRHGRGWRLWEVRPGLGRPLAESQRYLGDYVNGWLAFGCLDADLRKRLPNFPPDWFEMTDAELDALLNRSIDVPTRRR